MAASQQKNLAERAFSQVAKKFLKRQWWKLLIEAVPLVGDISPTFLLIVFSELREREKQGGNGIFSLEGIMMLSSAGTLDVAGWVCLVLDASLGIGFIISPAIAVSGYGMIGIWQIFSGGGSAPQEQENQK